MLSKKQAHRGEPVSLILCIGGLRLPLFDMYIGCREVFFLLLCKAQPVLLGSSGFCFMQEISADICGDINLIDSFCLGLKVYELSAFSALSKSENADNVDCSDM